MKLIRRDDKSINISFEIVNYWEGNALTAFDEKPHLNVDCLIREINIKYKYPFNFERSQLASIQDNFCSFSLLKNQNISKLSCHWFQSLFLRRHYYKL